MPKKSKLTDLNDHLFAQLERLSDEDIKGDKLNEEIERSKSVSLIARNIIDSARLALDAQRAFNDTVRELPPVLRIAEK